MSEAGNASDPSVRFARYSNSKSTYEFEEWILGMTPRFKKILRNRNGVDLVSCFGSLWTGAYADNFDFWFITSKMIEDSLKRTLIAEIGQIEMPKEGDLLLPAFSRNHAAVLSESPEDRTR
jgi:hypothetical protein